MKKIICLFILCNFFSHAQNNDISKALENHKLKMDSLEKALIQAKDDTTRINIYLALCEECDMKDNLKYAEPLLSLSQKLTRTTKDIKLKKRWMKQEAKAYLYFMSYHGNIDKDVQKALEYLAKQKHIYRALQDTDGIFNVTLTQANYYFAQFDIINQLKTLKDGYEEAKKMNAKLPMSRFNVQLAGAYAYVGDTAQVLKYMERGMELEKEIGDSTRIPRGNFLTGSFYARMGMYDRALPYYIKAAQLYEKINNRFRVAETYYQIGDVYFGKQQWDSALKNYERVVVISRQLPKTINNLVPMYFSMVNTGKVYAKTGNLKKALEVHEDALKLAEQAGEENAIAVANIALTEDYYAKKDFHKAKYYSDKALVFYNKLGYPSDILPREKIAYQIDSASNNLIDAYRHYYRYVQLKNKLNEEDIKKASAQEKFQSDLEMQKVMSQMSQEKQKAIFKEEKEKQNVIIYAVSGGLLLLLLVLVLIFRNLQQKQKTNKELLVKNEIIAQQKHMVEEKHKEITDSINYAERIQRSFLASDELLKSYLRDYFIFFQPKDVVSGDFYWAYASSKEKGKETFYLATADSTGHGVPGAIMSLLNITSLEKALEHHSEPAEILSHTRKTIIERLKKDGSAEGGKDGMDCSLVAFDFKNNHLSYAAANNPVWIVRGKQLIELACDKMPVGKHDKDQIPFTQHSFALQKNDVIYTLTDGMPDQFGGPKGKKFMYKQLKELLSNNAHLSMNEQHQSLRSALNAWKRDIEQVDDICIIGVRV